MVMMMMTKDEDLLSTGICPCCNRMLTGLSKNKDPKMSSFTKGITEEFFCLLHSSTAASQMVSQVVWLNLKVLHFAPQLFLQSCFVGATATILLL